MLMESFLHDDESLPFPPPPPPSAISSAFKFPSCTHPTTLPSVHHHHQHYAPTKLQMPIHNHIYMYVYITTISPPTSSVVCLTHEFGPTTIPVFVRSLRVPYTKLQHPNISNTILIIIILPQQLIIISKI